MVGVLKPHDGEITFNERVLVNTAEQQFVPTHQRHIGLIFQQAQLFPHLNVRQNLEYALRFNKKRPQNSVLSRL